ncbi:MAG: tetratricopeptide repeat protein [Elusimicrobiota bacterium]
MKARSLILTALLVPLAGRAWAAFEDLGVGARGPGMGNAFVAVADDVSALHYNPAGLGQLDRPEFMGSYTRLYWGLSDGSRLGTSFIGYAHPLSEGRRGTLATAWNSFTLDTDLYREDSFYVSYGKLCRPSGEGGLYLGTSLKYLRSSFGSFREASDSTDGIVVNTGASDPVLSGSRSHGAFDADLGALYRFGRHYSLGIALAHVPQPDMAFSPSDTDRLPMAVRMAGNYRSQLSNLVLQLDSRKGPTGQRDTDMTVAAERWFPRLFVGEFGARGAFGMGSRERREFTMGLSYRTRRMRVDYAFALPVQTVSSTAGSHRMAVSFRFGRASDAEESVEMVLEAMRQLKELARGRKAPALEGLDPGQKVTFTANMDLVRFYVNKAEYKNAAGQFAKALALAPADKDQLERFSELNLVAQHFESLPDHQNDPVEAALHRGIVAFLEGQHLEAMDKVSTALSMRPDDKRVEAFLAQIETATGIRRMTGMKPTPRSLILDQKLTQAEAAMEARRWNEAVEKALAVLREDETSARAWEALGTSYFALQDFESSRKAWSKAYEYEKSPSVRQAIRGTLRSIDRVIRERKAKASAARPAVSPLPERPKLSQAEVEDLFNKGVDHYLKHEFQEAARTFRAILEARPNHEEAARALQRVEEELRGRH